MRMISQARNKNWLRNQTTSSSLYTPTSKKNHFWDSFGQTSKTWKPIIFKILWLDIFKLYVHVHVGKCFHNTTILLGSTLYCGKCYNCQTSILETVWIPKHQLFEDRGSSIGKNAMNSVQNGHGHEKILYYSEPN